MDKIFIRDLEIETVIGVYEWEREIKQLVSVSLEMVFDTKKAGKSDKLQHSFSEIH